MTRGTTTVIINVTMNNHRDAGRPRVRTYRNPSLKVGVRDSQMRSPQKPSSIFSLSLKGATQQGTPLVSLQAAAIEKRAPPKSSLKPVTNKLPDRDAGDIIPALVITTKLTHHATTANSQLARNDQLVRMPHQEKPANEKAPKRQHRRHFVSARALYGASIVVIVIGGGLAYQAYSTNLAVDAQIEKLQTESSSTGDGSTSSSLPSDMKPANKNYLQDYKVGLALPRVLTIKKLNVKARIMQVGVDNDGKMGVPKTAYDVAWYNGSSRPGEAGAMVVDGHVQGVGGAAIFADLKKLAVGDQITVERGDGKVFIYSVRKFETAPVDKVDMGRLLVSVDTNVPGLNLITCAGSYDESVDSFDSRTIVYAVQQ